MGAMAAAAFPDKTACPSPEEFEEATGPAHDRWRRLDDWTRHTYGVHGEPVFSGASTGWTLRYRRGGRALFTLIPRSDGFSAQVVVGPAAWTATADIELTDATRAALDSAYPYPDGRWAWLDVADDGVAADVMRLVALKSPPPKRRVEAHA